MLEIPQNSCHTTVVLPQLLIRIKGKRTFLVYSIEFLKVFFSTQKLYFFKKNLPPRKKHQIYLQVCPKKANENHFKSWNKFDRKNVYLGVFEDTEYTFEIRFTGCMNMNIRRESAFFIMKK